MALGKKQTRKNIFNLQLERVKLASQGFFPRVALTDEVNHILFLTVRIQQKPLKERTGETSLRGIASLAEKNDQFDHFISMCIYPFAKM